MPTNDIVHSRSPITTVNYHCWKPCNMRCRHCFARFADAGHDNLPRAEMLAVVQELARGFERINFVGGEPTLCPWLPEALQLARNLGLATSLVTNGATMSSQPAHRDAVLKLVDWIGLSIDSGDENTNRVIGRAIGKHVPSVGTLVALSDFVHRHSVGLKVNTVVQRANLHEDFHDLIGRLRPERWKVLQVLPIIGQNDRDYADLAITAAEFAGFVARHGKLVDHGVVIVPEDHEAMTGSYAMVDPGGYAYDNVNGRHHYSSAPVHQVGWQAAFAEVRLLTDRFLARGGAWSSSEASR